MFQIYSPDCSKVCSARGEQFALIGWVQGG